MTEADDMNTMAALADLLVDEYLGGHTDAILTTLFTVNKGIFRNEKPVIRLLLGLIGELINKVYDLEKA